MYTTLRVVVTFFILMTLILSAESGPVGGIADLLDAAPSWAPECPARKGKIPRLIPNPWDCRSLFICASGTASEYYCPGNDVFDPERQECVKGSASSCMPGSKKWSPFSTCLEGKRQYFRHPTRCNFFYQCSPQGACLKRCPPGTFFDETINVCNWERNVNCKSKLLIPVKAVNSVSSMTVNESDICEID